MREHWSANSDVTNAGGAQGRAVTAGPDLDPPSQPAKKGPLIPPVRTVFVSFCVKLWLQSLWQLAAHIPMHMHTLH